MTLRQAKIPAPADYAAVPVGDGIVLHFAPGAEAAADRFASAWRAVWRGLPPATRTRVRNHWRRVEAERARGRRRARDGSPPGRRLPPVPFIAVEAESIEYVADGRRGRRRGSTAAMVSRGGTEMRFLGALVARLPRPALCALVAHEIGHVVQYAVDSPALHFGDVDPGEWEASGAALGWGFPVEVLDREMDRIVEGWRRGLPIFRERKRRRRRRK